MKVAVTGAAGRLGRRTCAALVAVGDDVAATDRSTHADMPAHVEVLDLLDRYAIHRVLEDCQALVHLGNHPDFQNHDTQRIYSENTAMNVNAFQAAVELGVRKIIFASSIQVVAGGERVGREVQPVVAYLPLDSASPPNPGNPYALSKIAGEQLLTWYAQRQDIAGVALRLPWLLAGSDVETLLARMPDPPAEATVAQGFSFLSYEDAAQSIVACLHADLPGYRVYLPAARRNTLGRPPRELIAAHYQGIPLRRPVEQIQTLVDITTVQAETGWAPSM